MDFWKCPLMNRIPLQSQTRPLHHMHAMYGGTGKASKPSTHSNAQFKLRAGELKLISSS